MAAGMFSSELTFRTVSFDKAAAQAAQHVVHIDASHGPESVIAHGARALFTELGSVGSTLCVEHLHLWEDPVRRKIEYNLEHVRSKMAMLKQEANVEDVKSFAGIEELAAQLASARGLVISAPMWNYGPPWILKQYFDCVLHPGLTFVETPAGPQGVCGGGRPCVVITSSGGSASKDYLTPWLLDIAAMVGFDKPHVVAAPNVAHAQRQLLLDGIAASAREAAAHLCGKGTQADQAPSKAPVAAGTGGASTADEPDDVPAEDWGCAKVMWWLRLQGGLSSDGLDSVESARIDGVLFCQAADEDWRNEELGLEDADVERVLELQKVFLQAVRGPAAARE
eukprot:CAMPEP_0197915046 /NCGR_PEP_ID=MMETSP1439-20131203/79540_1 /TAXON_ID=66791 /ORGANISM="Gonyaulax spinifera, Strain CCMP409" /LENGTH=337 /DNA_ID=CAMNT_0043536983 /DNA_START=62 /DNA_END=1075 /DNA_ORIENTATION=-